MLRKLLTSWPFLIVSGVVDRLVHYAASWMTYCRIRRWFPDADDLHMSFTTQFKYRENVKIGRHVKIGPGVIIGAHSLVILEDYARISQNATLETAGLDLAGTVPYSHQSRPITVKRGAWIGAGAIILGGVTVGENAVVAAGAIVARDVPSGAVVVGSGTRILERKWNGESPSDA